MPLTEKGKEIKTSMERQYGKEEGERVFYASENKGTIKGVHAGMDAIANSTTITDAVMGWGRSGQTEVYPGGFGDPAKMPAAASQSSGYDERKK